MILIVGILLILYGIFARKKYSVWVGMAFVLLIMGFQEGIPGDYDNYKSAFQSGNVGLGSLDSTAKEGEFAYIWIVETLSRFMSFHVFVLLSSLVQCLILGLFVKEYTDKKYQYFGVLLLFFTFNMMLLQMKALRQGYAVDMLLLSYLLLERKKYFWSLVPAVLAYGFHNSSIIALPFFVVLWFISYHHRKEQIMGKVIVKSKSSGILIAFGALTGLLIFYVLKYIVFASYINPILEGLEFFSYTSYLDQIEENREISWWIILYYAVSVFAVALYYVNERNYFQRYIALLTLIALFLSVGTFGFGNLMRTTAYYICFSIVVFPNVAAMLRATYGKNIALGFVLFNMVFLMITSVKAMVSMDTSSGTGFGPYTFSFLNW